MLKNNHCIAAEKRKTENIFSPVRCPIIGYDSDIGSVSLTKDEKNLIGISIGGGAPLCPCLYVVQIFDNTPAAKDGTLQSGDELVGVNGQSVKGRTKVEVARMIQSIKQGDVVINYNKLHADPKQGKTLDIVLKKVKHRVVESMNSNTADALGLSRAILCNDGLVKKLQELERTAETYKGLIEHMKKLLKCTFELSQSHKAFGDAFSSIGVREPQPAASEAFSQFGEAHRDMERFAIKMLKTVKPMISDLNTFLNKAVPDTRLTIKKYLDGKFEYLSYCLKVKEMDDEEYSYAALQEPLYRVETGNYEYRLVLRCRQEARVKFAKMRSDVLVKMELLDQKHVYRNLLKVLRYSQYSQVRSMATAQMEKPVENSIRRKLTDTFQPAVLDVINESYMHSVPKGSETHFKVVVVADQFEKLALIKRHRLINETLQEELQTGVHALSIVAKTPKQWEDSGGAVSKSPPCQGGAGL